MANSSAPFGDLYRAYEGGRRLTAKANRKQAGPRAKATVCTESRPLNPSSAALGRISATFHFRRSRHPGPGCTKQRLIGHFVDLRDFFFLVVILSTHVNWTFRLFEATHRTLQRLESMAANRLANSGGPNAPVSTTVRWKLLEHTQAAVLR
jgi:hypothetical protein